MIEKLLHASLLITDLSVSRAFYEVILGLQPNLSRPVLSTTGIWYDIGAAQLHLLVSSATTKEKSLLYPGEDAHIALQVQDVEQLKQRLEQAKIVFTTSRSGRKAVFCRDPDGHALEFTQAQ